MHGIDAGEFFLVGDQARPRVHGVEHVFFELGGERRQLLHHGLVSGFAFRRQSHAREPEVFERAFDDAALGGVERAGFVRGDRRVGAEQGLALRQVGPVVRQQRQAGVVAGAQFVGIEHAVQVADGRPGARQAVRELLERQHGVGEGRVRLGLERRDFTAIALQQLADGGLHFGGGDAIEGGKRGPADVCVGHLVPRTARTGSVSGRTPRHRVNASAACSTSMPQPLWARAQPCSMDQLTKGVDALL